MSIMPAILLVNVANNEKHHLNAMESVIGRGWLNCDDKRISRNHGILKIISSNSIAIHSTHQNLMFFRKKNDAALNQIEQNKEVNLFIGDSFGLLVDEFWFSIQSLDNANGLNGNVIQQNVDEPTTSGPKRKTSSDSEPDSTNKRVKTEPMEYQENDTTFDDLNTTIDYQSRNEMTNGMPSTSASSPLMNVEQNDTIANQPIKIEPSNSNEVQSMPTIRIKTEPMSQESYVDSTITPVPIQIKTEVKNEPIDNNDGETSSCNTQRPVQQRVQRPCCQYGIRCYRRNPLHRAEEAHPGDVDYRLPDYPDPPLGAPPCPFLDRCYRRNPLHFQQFSHKTTLRPNGKEGYEATAKPPQALNLTTTNTTTNTNANGNASDSESEADPYATDDDQDDDYQGQGTSDSDDNA